MPQNEGTAWYDTIVTAVVSIATGLMGSLGGYWLFRSKKAETTAAVEQAEAAQEQQMMNAALAEHKRNTEELWRIIGDLQKRVKELEEGKKEREKEHEATVAQLRVERDVLVNERNAERAKVLALEFRVSQYTARIDHLEDQVEKLGGKPYNGEHGNPTDPTGQLR